MDKILPPNLCPLWVHESMHLYISLSIIICCWEEQASVVDFRPRNQSTQNKEENDTSIDYPVQEQLGDKILSIYSPIKFGPHNTISNNQ